MVLPNVFLIVVECIFQVTGVIISSTKTTQLSYFDFLNLFQNIDQSMQEGICTSRYSLVSSKVYFIELCYSIIISGFCITTNTNWRSALHKSSWQRDWYIQLGHNWSKLLQFFISKTNYRKWFLNKAPLNVQSITMS